MNKKAAFLFLFSLSLQGMQPNARQAYKSSVNYGSWIALAASFTWMAGVSALANAQAGHCAKASHEPCRTLAGTTAVGFGCLVGLMRLYAIECSREQKLPVPIQGVIWDRYKGQKSIPPNILKQLKDQIPQLRAVNSVAVMARVNGMLFTMLEDKGLPPEIAEMICKNIQSYAIKRKKELLQVSAGERELEKLLEIKESLPRSVQRVGIPDKKHSCGKSQKATLHFFDGTKKNNCLTAAYTRLKYPELLCNCPGQLNKEENVAA